MNPATKEKTLLILGTTLAAKIWKPVVSDASHAVTKDELILLYNQVRKKVMEEDPLAFEQLIPVHFDINKELDEAEGLIENIFPDLDAVRFHKLSRNTREILLVVLTCVESEKAFFLDMFRFGKLNGRWMLLTKFQGKPLASVPRSSHLQRYRAVEVQPQRPHARQPSYASA